MPAWFSNRDTGLAMLPRSAEHRAPPLPGQACPPVFGTGIPSAVLPIETGKTGLEFPGPPSETPRLEPLARPFPAVHPGLDAAPAGLRSILAKGPGPDAVGRGGPGFGPWLRL